MRRRQSRCQGRADCPMLCYKLIEEGETMVPLGFDYDPEILAKTRPFSTPSRLKRYGRDRSSDEGKRPGHPDADDDDF
jgi:hypothetical protein